MPDVLDSFAAELKEKNKLQNIEGVDYQIVFGTVIPESRGWHEIAYNWSPTMPEGFDVDYVRMAARKLEILYTIAKQMARETYRSMLVASQKRFAEVQNDMFLTAFRTMERKPTGPHRPINLRIPRILTHFDDEQSGGDVSINMVGDGQDQFIGNVSKKRTKCQALVARNDPTPYFLPETQANNLRVPTELIMHFLNVLTVEDWKQPVMPVEFGPARHPSTTWYWDGLKRDEYFKESSKYWTNRVEELISNFIETAQTEMERSEMLPGNERRYCSANLYTDVPAIVGFDKERFTNEVGFHEFIKIARAGSEADHELMRPDRPFARLQHDPDNRESWTVTPAVLRDWEKHTRVLAGDLFVGARFLARQTWLAFRKYVTETCARSLPASD